MPRFTVGGTPWEDLTEEQHKRISQRATEVVSEIVSKHAQSMIDEGKSLGEIQNFLGIDKEVKQCSN